MKKLISFIVVLTFAFSLATPLNNVYAQSPESKGNSVDIIVDETLLNGTEPFSIVEEIDNNKKEDNVITPYGTTEFYVTLKKLAGGSLLAQ